MGDPNLGGSPPFNRRPPQASTYTPPRTGNGVSSVPASGRGGPSPIKLLIQSAEQGRSELNDYRVRRVEALLKDREEEVATLQARFIQLRDDFEYNLRLLHERDADLARYDATLDNLRAAVTTREAQLGEARKMFAEIEAEARQEKAREGSLVRANEELRLQLQASKREAEVETQRLRDEAERVRKDFEQQLKVKELEAEAKRQQASTSAQLLLRQRESEQAQTIADLTARLQAAESSLKRKSDETESEKQKAEKLSREVTELRLTARESETKAAKATQEAAEAKRQRDERVASLESEQREVTALRADLLEEYDRRSAELLQSLKLAEAALEEQRQEQAAREGRLHAANKALRLRCDAMAARVEVAGVPSNAKYLGTDPNSDTWLVSNDSDDLEVEAARAAQEIEVLRGEIRAFQRREQELKAYASQQSSSQEATDRRRAYAAHLLGSLALAYARTAQAVANPVEGANRGLVGALKTLVSEVESGLALDSLPESDVFRDERDEIELEVRRLKRLARASIKPTSTEETDPVKGSETNRRRTVKSNVEKDRTGGDPVKERSRAGSLSQQKGGGKETGTLGGTTTWAEVRVVSQKEAEAAMQSSGEGGLREKLANMERCVQELLEAERRRQRKEDDADANPKRRVTSENATDVLLRRHKLDEADWETASMRSSDRGEGTPSTARHSLRSNSLQPRSTERKPSRTPSPPLWRPAGGSIEINRAKSVGRSRSMMLPTKSSLARTKSVLSGRRSARSSLMS